MKLEGKVESFVIDEKRFKLPGVKLVGKCPNCGVDHSRDFVRDPLGHPTANEPMDVHCYCGKCGHEWWVSVVLHVSLELVA